MELFKKIFRCNNHKKPIKQYERPGFEEQSRIDNEYYDNWAKQENKVDCNHLGYSVTQLGNGPWRCVNCLRPLDY